MRGIVHLVGAGPGDPGLLTVAGRRALEEAEVVVHDRLGTEELLPLCRPDAELIDAGKAPGRAALTQEQINAVLVEQGAAGRRVVRLKGGDPFVFGRGGEEAQALTAADVPYVVVPGVTSAIAAPAYAGIPITHRGVATAFTVVTGHEDPDKPSEQTDWAALAATGGTLSILMGMGRLGGIADALIAAGRPPDEPAAAVQWGTTPRQRSVVATLSTLADRVREAGLGSPAVVVVGPVAALAPEIAWREGPLLGRTVVVTRARAQASGLTERLRALGASVVELPAIRIHPLDETPEDAAMLAGIGSYGLVVLTSVNGVDALFERLGRLGRDARAIPEEATVVAIGPATAERLLAHGVRPDLVPERFVAEGILEALADRPLEGVRTLVARAYGARPDLVDGLAELGALVDELELYEAVPEAASVPAREAALGADWLTFTASSTVRAFMGLLGDGERAALRGGPRVISIGPVTSATAREEGLEVHAEAREHTIPGLIDALLEDAGLVISLLTDFGAGSEHVGALHAVLAVGAPGVERVDLAHDLPAGDVRGASLVLARLAPLLPGAVHLAVVDPGVGTPRRAAAVQLDDGGALIGPDNGLLAPAAGAIGAAAAVALTPPTEGAATFHGRDLFAPAAARIARGVPVTDLGEAFDPASLVRPELPPAEVRDGHLRAPAVAIDRFGNVQLLARQADLAAAGFTRGDRIWAAVTDRRHPATVGRVFADAAPKGMLVHIDSHGMVAIAVNGGDAARRVGAAIGDEVTLGRWDLRR